jgi:uracil-DNA glycosylase family 4
MDTRALFGELERVWSQEPQYYDAPFYGDLKACTRCTCRGEATQVVPGVGPRDAEIIFAGRNPGGDEDRGGLPFIGRGGSELNRMCEALGIERTKCGIVNVVKCHTLGDRAPRKEEVETCVNSWLELELQFFHKARLIFPLGKEAIQVFLGFDAESPARREGYFVEIKGPGGRMFTVCPLNHPGYLLRARRYQVQMYNATLPMVKDSLEKGVLKDVLSRAAPNS